MFSHFFSFAIVFFLVFAPIVSVFIPTSASAAAPVISFVSKSGSFNEGFASGFNGDEVAMLQLTGSGSGPITVRFAVTGISATENQDYEILNDEITLPTSPLQTSYNLKIINDTKSETNETLLIQIISASGATINAAKDRFTLTIVDDEPPEVSFATSASSVNENAGMANVTVQTNKPTTNAVTVQFLVIGAMPFIATSDDYSVSGNTVTIPSGSQSASIPVTIVNDTAVENNELVRLTLIEVTEGTASINSSKSMHTITIVDNDALPVISFQETSGSFFESNADANTEEEVAAIQLTGSGSGPITVTYQVTGLSASAGSDYQVTQTQATYPSSPLSSSYGLNILPDTQFEGDETVQIKIVSATNATIDSNKNTFTLTIIDDDPAPETSLPTVRFQESGGTFLEANANAALTEEVAVVELVGSGSQSITVTYQVTGISATAGSDYQVVTTVQTYPKSPLFTSYGLNILPDTLFEGDETVQITIVSATNASVDPNKKTYLLTIVDDDPAPPPSQPDPQPAPGSSGSGSDITPPAIVLKGSTTITLTVGQLYLDPGFTASDNVDGNISSKVVVNDSAVNTSKAGTYMVTYSVSDSAGNKATATRTVTVQNLPPSSGGSVSPPPSSGSSPTALPASGSGSGQKAPSLNNKEVAPNPSEPSLANSTGTSTPVTFETNQPPIAGLAELGAIQTGAEAQFMAEGSTDPDGNIQWYVWNFGDGTEEKATQGPSASHIYTVAGSYSVQLTVIDTFGEKNDATTTVTVLDTIPEEGSGRRALIVGIIIVLAAIGAALLYLQKKKIPPATPLPNHTPSPKQNKTDTP